ncbi:MAG: type IV pilus twitching motility protein PilT [Desulfomonile tiedjei]|uniref:Type IV pilus twitching motility protein PilT n=1 Tax=Desulfomonile tiedjei TaxID=2358 RepID=A0A9D6V4H4_9BACT|nr:type IV pilus twitching motility protein PilT [Desulfomonile tiedjei]
MAQIDSLLHMAVQSKASDVHVATGSCFILRQFGRLRAVKSPILAPEAAKSLIYEILTPGQRKHLEQNLQLDFGYDLKGVARFRGNVILQRKGLDATFRIIPAKLPSLSDLGLPPVVVKFCDFHQGLILVTGATGQGKSTTLASMIDLINSSRPVHILTVEDPIEFVHPVKKGLVNQRQLGVHTRSFANALRAALREDPDVIMVGEMRDLESIRLAITAAETGHLVMGTLSTSSGPKTVDRLIDSFPPDEQNQIRTMLSESLRAVITQKLLPAADGRSQVLVSEIMIGTVPLANLIRTEKTFQLPSIMQTGRAQGMQLMDDSIMQVLQAKKISVQTAQEAAENKKRFM